MAPIQDWIYEESTPTVQRERIRYLLARRLTRTNRGDEAREYYPAKFRPRHDALMQALVAGGDEGQPTETRATNLFAVAQIFRNEGMELMGTERWHSDWHVVMGEYADFDLVGGGARDQ